jgi:DNA-binding Xre family transcriptional regulator
MTTYCRLRELMEARSPVPSIRQVALDAGLNYETVHRLYSNKAKGADFTTLDALAKALGCAPGELIGKAKRGKA